MIVSAAHRFCYLAIPKTGSKSMHQFLEQNPYGGRRAGSAYHGNVFTKPGPTWCVWSVVRNPYARLASWWWFTCRANRSNQPNHEREFWGDKDLTFFVRWLADHVDGNDVPHQRDMRQPQHVFLSRCEVDRVIRLENIAEEFDALPFAHGDGHRIPRVRQASERKSWMDGGKTWLDYYDQETLDLANEYGAADEAEAFGYRPVHRITGDRPDGWGDPSPIAPVAWTSGGVHR